MEAVCSSETLWYLPARPHGVTTQKTNIDDFAAARTSNLKIKLIALVINKMAAVNMSDLPSVSS
jgi:hypothetical protein